MTWAWRCDKNEWTHKLLHSRKLTARYAKNDGPWKRWLPLKKYSHFWYLRQISGHLLVGDFLFEALLNNCPSIVDPALKSCQANLASRPSFAGRGVNAKKPPAAVVGVFLPLCNFLFCSLKKVEWMVRTFQKILMKNPHPKHRMDINPFQPCSDLYTQTLKGFQTVGETQFTWGSRTHLK